MIHFIQYVYFSFSDMSLRMQDKSYSRQLEPTHFVHFVTGSMYSLSRTTTKALDWNILTNHVFILLWANVASTLRTYTYYTYMLAHNFLISPFSSICYVQHVLECLPAEAWWDSISGPAISHNHRPFLFCPTIYMDTTIFKSK